MPTIAITRELNGSLDVLRPIVDDIRVKLNERYNVESFWVNECQVTLKRDNITGTMVLNDNYLELTLKVPLMMMAFKSQIEQQLDSVIARKLPHA